MEIKYKDLHPVKGSIRWYQVLERNARILATAENVAIIIIIKLNCNSHFTP